MVKRCTGVQGARERGDEQMSKARECSAKQVIMGADYGLWIMDYGRLPEGINWGTSSIILSRKEICYV